MTSEELNRLMRLLAVGKIELARAIGRKTKRKVSYEDMLDWTEGRKDIPRDVVAVLEQIDADFRAHMAM